MGKEARLNLIKRANANAKAIVIMKLKGDDEPQTYIIKDFGLNPATMMFRLELFISDSSNVPVPPTDYKLSKETYFKFISLREVETYDEYEIEEIDKREETD